MNWLMGRSKSASKAADLLDMLSNVDKALQAVPRDKSAELQPKWEAMRDAFKSSVQEMETNEAALQALQKENGGLKSSLKEERKKFAKSQQDIEKYAADSKKAEERAQVIQKEMKDLKRQTDDLHHELKQRDESAVHMQGEIERNASMLDELTKRTEAAETRQNFHTYFATLVHAHPAFKDVTRGIDHFRNRLEAFQTISDNVDTKEIEQQIQAEVDSNFPQNDQDELEKLSDLISDLTPPGSLDKILSQLEPFKHVPGEMGTIITNLWESVSAVKHEFSQSTALAKEDKEIEQLFNDYLFGVYSKLKEEGDQMHVLERDFEDGEEQLKHSIKSLSHDLNCHHPIKDRGKKEQERCEAMQELIDYYSKNIERVGSHQSPIAFLQKNLTCFRDQMDKRKHECSDELSQHDQNVIRKQERAKHVKQWSREKETTRNKEGLHARWCEMTAKVLQQDASNTLMKCLSSLDMCTTWIVWARATRNRADKICSCSCKWQTSMAKQLDSDEQVYQRAHNRTKRGAELLEKIRLCVESAYIELINKSNRDDKRFREHMPEYEKRLTAVKKVLRDELLDRKHHFQHLVRDCMMRATALETDINNLQYANLPEGNDMFDKKTEELQQCLKMKDSYEQQLERVNRLAIYTTGVELTPDGQMEVWLGKFHFNRPRRMLPVMHSLTDAYETTSMQSYSIISLLGDDGALPTGAEACHHAELNRLRKQPKDQEPMKECEPEHENCHGPGLSAGNSGTGGEDVDHQGKNVQMGNNEDDKALGSSETADMAQDFVKDNVETSPQETKISSSLNAVDATISCV